MKRNANHKIPHNSCWYVGNRIIHLGPFFLSLCVCAHFSSILKLCLRIWFNVATLLANVIILDSILDYLLFRWAAKTKAHRCIMSLFVMCLCFFLMTVEDDHLPFF